MSSLWKVGAGSGGFAQSKGFLERDLNARIYLSSYSRATGTVSDLSNAIVFTRRLRLDMLDRSMAVTKAQLRKVITKLDDIKLELLRLRAALLPEEQVTAKETRLIELGRREIKKGRFVTLGQLRLFNVVCAKRSMSS